MARYFIRLKARLIANGLRGRARKGFFVMGAILALYVAGGGFTILAGARSGLARTVVPVLAFSGFFVGWIVVPLIGFGVDETLDPDRVSLLPLSRRELMAGLLAASCVGLGPAATLLALCGAIAANARWPGEALSIVAVLVEFLMCVTVARTASTGLARMLRSRRLRDVALVMVSLLAIAAGFIGQLPRLLGETAASRGAVVLARFARWWPPGMAGHAVVDAANGRVVVALLELLACLAFVALLVTTWAVNLERLLTTATASAIGRRGSTAGDATLIPRLVRFLPRNRIGAVAAKDLRLLWREPLMRSQRVMTALFAVGAIVALAIAPNLHHAQVVVGAAGFLWWFNLSSVNLFAIDRAAYWMNVTAAGEPRDDLLGKNVASLVLNVPMFALLAVGAAAITGGWIYIPVAMSLGVAILGTQFAVGNVTSVRLAQPLAGSSTNPWAVRSGQNLVTGLVLVGALLGTALLVSPVAGAIAFGLASSRLVLWVACPIAVVYGLGAYVVGLRVAATWLRTHQPELLSALSPAAAA